MKMRSFMGRSVLGATLVASAFGVTSVSGEAHAWPMPKVSVDLPKVPSGVEENDRKQLSELAIHQPAAFNDVIAKAKTALGV